jgi:hypothetical protein
LADSVPIFEKQNQFYSHGLTNGGVWISAGPLELVRRENPLVFKESVEARRLGFPPVIMPGTRQHLAQTPLHVACPIFK